MYTRFFGLRENPFALPPDPSYLYLGGGDREALAHLRYGIEEGSGFVQLTGEVGTGKTLLVRAAVETLPGNIDVALILYPILSVFEFVKTICDELRVPYPADAHSLKDLIDGLNAHLLESHAQGRRTVLIIDEAQNLSREVLEQVRLLTNLETTKQKLLQIVLVGQPELDSLLAQHNLRQLAQRITARYRLASLSRGETYSYVLHRCRVAGAEQPLFSRAALRWVYTLTKGVPRLINIVCDRALLGAYANDQPMVNAGVLRRAAAEVDLRLGPKGQSWPRMAVAAGLGAVVLGAALWYGAVAPLDSQRPLAANGEHPSRPPILAGPMADERAAKDPRPSVVPLDTLLLEHAATTETALKDLFAHWGASHPGLSADNACTLARQDGLRCLRRSGTWNNLRTFNRPAIVELIDSRGRPQQVLVVALDANNATLELAGQRHVIALNEIDRLWYGDYLLLWRARLLERGILQRGAQGPAVAQLRTALAAYRGDAPAATLDDRFDETLERRVTEFQRAHRIAPDGVVGELTALHLSGYERDAALPGLAKAGGR